MFQIPLNAEAELKKIIAGITAEPLDASKLEDVEFRAAEIVEGLWEVWDADGVFGEDLYDDEEERSQFSWEEFCSQDVGEFFDIADHNEFERIIQG